MKKWELELENKNLKKNCKILMKENKSLKALLHNKDWHYVSEEGFPEAGQYYFIAYKGPLGVSCSYCKLVNKNVPGLPIYDEKGCLVRMAMDGSFTTKEWDFPGDIETKAWLNENGRVYAWIPSPALPEVR